MIMVLNTYWHLEHLSPRNVLFYLLFSRDSIDGLCQKHNHYSAYYYTLLAYCAAVISKAPAAVERHLPAGRRPMDATRQRSRRREPRPPATSSRSTDDDRVAANNRRRRTRGPRYSLPLPAGTLLAPARRLAAAVNHGDVPVPYEPHVRRVQRRLERLADFPPVEQISRRRNPTRGRRKGVRR